MPSPIRKFWEENENFSDRPRIDFDTNINFSEATRQLNELIKSRPDFTQLVELGSGSGEYLDYLKAKLPPLKNIIGSDVDSPRLHRARKDFPHLSFEAADALDMIKKYNQPGTIFLAMNVICSLTPSEIKKLFSLFKIPGTAFVFCERGLTLEVSGKSLESPNHQFDHNMIDLLRNSRLTIRHAQFKYDHNEQKRSVYIVTAIVE